MTPDRHDEPAEPGVPAEVAPPEAAEAAAAEARAEPAPQAGPIDAIGGPIDAIGGPIPDETALPGAHRGGFTRLPTAPVGSAASGVPSDASAASGHPLGVAEPDLEWIMPDPPHRGVSGWALTVAIAGLIGSFFVGWGFPVGLVAIVLSIVALRRPVESRLVSGWALALGILSVLYSVGWLLFAAHQGSA